MTFELKKKEVIERCLVYTTPINHQCFQINHEPPTDVNNNGRHNSTSSHGPALRLPYDVALPAQARAVISSQTGQSQNRKLQYECVHISSCTCQSSCYMFHVFLLLLNFLEHTWTTQYCTYIKQLTYLIYLRIVAETAT